MRLQAGASVWIVFLLLTPGMLLASPDQKESVDRIASNLICVCGCANMVVSNCSCGTAAKTKVEIAQLLDKGKSEADIFRIFEERHGKWVLAAPEAKGFNLLAWVLPFLALAVGTGVVVWVIRELTPEAPAPLASRVEIDDETRRLIEEEVFR